MFAKETDDKGRVTLGKKFANRMVIVKEVDDTEVVVTIARVIPEREAWLYDNATVKAAVFAGIEAARCGQFADAPSDIPAIEEDESADTAEPDCKEGNA